MYTCQDDEIDALTFRCLFLWEFSVWAGFLFGEEKGAAGWYVQHKMQIAAGSPF